MRELQILWFHAGISVAPDDYSRRRATAHLRPFSGEIEGAGFEEVLELATRLRDAGAPGDELVAGAYALAQMAATVDAWALRPDGMLQRNKLLRPRQRTELAGYVDQLRALSRSMLRATAAVSRIEGLFPIE